ncbi:MAG: hypothetical protein Q4C47_00265 [Planctomycetia bacterium]|nr:hypothetical protein [Planctomycetia bacterium]
MFSGREVETIAPMSLEQTKRISDARADEAWVERKSEVPCDPAVCGKPIRNAMKMFSVSEGELVQYIQFPGSDSRNGGGPCGERTSVCRSSRIASPPSDDGFSRDGYRPDSASARIECGEYPGVVRNFVLEGP